VQSPPLMILIIEGISYKVGD